MNLKESLIHHGSLGEDDFVIIEVDQLETKEVRRGVVFMYAKWSSFSISCWQVLGLHYMRKKPNVPLFVVDVDNVNSMKSVELFGEIIEGNGETFAVRDGEIVRRGSKYGNGSDEFIGELIRSVQ